MPILGRKEIRVLCADIREALRQQHELECMVLTAQLVDMDTRDLPVKILMAVNE